MGDVPIIYDDLRPIASIWFECEVGTHHAVGTHGCTKIVAYKEYGDYAFVPWLAVYHGDHLQARVPARLVTIIYADTNKGGSNG